MSKQWATGKLPTGLSLLLFDDSYGQSSWHCTRRRDVPFDQGDQPNVLIDEKVDIADETENSSTSATHSLSAQPSQQLKLENLQVDGSGHQNVEMVANFENTSMLTTHSVGKQLAEGFSKFEVDNVDGINYETTNMIANNNPTVRLPSHSADELIQEDKLFIDAPNRETIDTDVTDKMGVIASPPHLSEEPVQDGKRCIDFIDASDSQAVDMVAIDRMYTPASLVQAVELAQEQRVDLDFVDSCDSANNSGGMADTANTTALAIRVFKKRALAELRKSVGTGDPRTVHSLGDVAADRVGRQQSNSHTISLRERRELMLVGAKKMSAQGT